MAVACLREAIPNLQATEHHVIARRYDWPNKGGEDVCVIVARGKAAAILMDCVRDDVPPFREG